jgi:hypothetical protein
MAAVESDVDGLPGFGGWGGGGELQWLALTEKLRLVNQL